MTTTTEECYRKEHSELNARRSACLDCGELGYHVDTRAGEIIPHGSVTAVAPAGETWLMVDPDGELRCDDCSTTTDTADVDALCDHLEMIDDECVECGGSCTVTGIDEDGICHDLDK